MSVLSRYKVSVQVMSEQQMEVEDERGGREGGREGAHCYQSYSAILSSPLQ